MAKIRRRITNVQLMYDAQGIGVSPATSRSAFAKARAAAPAAERKSVAPSQVNITIEQTVVGDDGKPTEIPTSQATKVVDDADIAGFVPAGGLNWGEAEVLAVARAIWDDPELDYKGTD